jgi:hypothetical protein
MEPMEPIDIVIMEEEEPVVHVAERQPPALVERATATGRAVARGAQAGWERLPREQMKAAAEAGAVASRHGAVRGLRWLSARLSDLAERLGSRA